MSDELLKLAERCEAATAPDFEIDRDIELFFGRYDVVGGGGQTYAPPHYTTSLDAAMMLVSDLPASAMGTTWAVEQWDTNGVWPEHVRASAWVIGASRVYAATPALALCAASLKACSAALRAAQEMGK